MGAEVEVSWGRTWGKLPVQFSLTDQGKHALCVNCSRKGQKASVKGRKAMSRIKR